ISTTAIYAAKIAFFHRKRAKKFSPAALINVQCTMNNVHPVARNATIQPLTTPFRPSFIIHNS
ncbi:MAG: hypothetical protein K5901_00330, partial [Bacteroidales bacterium]|nr:hypothetical protein [Bacteroidales bacterium]